MGQEIYERSPVRVLASHLEGGLGRGKVGFIAAEPGVGKSALLVHLALDTLLREENVLHVSMTDSVDHVRQFYDQIVRAASRASRAARPKGHWTWSRVTISAFAPFCSSSWTRWSLTPCPSAVMAKCFPATVSPLKLMAGAGLTRKTYRSRS